MRRLLTVRRLAIAVILLAGLFVALLPNLSAAPPWLRGKRTCDECRQCEPASGDIGGNWYWMRSPEEEKVVIAGLYNRYCVRCHAVDGRGVWDIPHVPDLTNPRWQATRSDAQLARIILEGRGAVMPPFRGTLTLEESWAMARYLRTFVPGTETSKPLLGTEAPRHVQTPNPVQTPSPVETPRPMPK